METLVPGGVVSTKAASVTADSALRREKICSGQRSRANPRLRLTRRDAPAPARVRRHERFAFRQNHKVNWPQAKRGSPGGAGNEQGKENMNYGKYYFR